MFTCFYKENIGAVRELSKVIDNLGHRIDELETRISSLIGSNKSKQSMSSKSWEFKTSRRGWKPEGSMFRNRWIQGVILVMVSLMTVCLLPMAMAMANNSAR